MPIKTSKKTYRKSEVRDQIFKILQSAKKPLDVAFIQKELRMHGLLPNKTSVYRAIKGLMDMKLITEFDFLNGRKLYEILDEKGHHHHLVCISCQKTECLKLEEKIHSIQHDLEKNLKYKILSHNIDFFGICDNCQIEKQFNPNFK